MREWKVKVKMRAREESKNQILEEKNRKIIKSSYDSET